MSTCTVDRKQFQVRKIGAHASESKYALIECSKMDCFQLNTLSLYWFISIQYHLGHRYHRHPADFFLFIRVAPQRKFRRPGGIPDICHICYATALFRQKSTHIRYTRGLDGNIDKPGVRLFHIFTSCYMTLSMSMLSMSMPIGISFSPTIRFSSPPVLLFL